MPPLEKPETGSTNQAEPPHGKNFATHLWWHLQVNGTRPTGRPDVAGRTWSRREFADALERARQRKSNDGPSDGERGLTNPLKDEQLESNDEPSNAERSLSNWLDGRTCSGKWFNIVEEELFGRPQKNGVYEGWRRQFRIAHATKSQRLRRSKRYVQELQPGHIQFAERMIADLIHRGWRLDSMDRGEAITNPKFNTDLIVDQPVIHIVRLSGKWEARDYYHQDLETFVLTEVKKRSSEWFNDHKIRLASDILNRRSIDIQETDYLSSLMTDQLGWNHVRSEELQRTDGRPEVVLRRRPSMIASVRWAW